MKRVFYVLMVCAILTVIALGAAQAGITMWFTDSLGYDVTTLNVAPGAAFTVKVYGTTTVESIGLGLAVKIATTTGGVGQSASAEDNKITFATVVGNGSAGADVTWSSDIQTKYDLNIMAPTTAGLRLTGATKNWGVAMTRESSGSTAAFSNVLIATLNLKNNMALGEQYNIEIVAGSISASSYNSFSATLAGAPFATTSDVLTVKSVPEPSSILALFTGLASVGFVIRRKK